MENMADGLEVILPSAKRKKWAQEKPVGAIDGVNKTFTVVKKPAVGGAQQCVVRGLERPDFAWKNGDPKTKEFTFTAVEDAPRHISDIFVFRYETYE